MPFDNLDRARKLRAKAADPAVPPAEAKTLREKAAELEAKERKLNSPPTDNTSATGFGNHPEYGTTPWEEWAKTFNDARLRKAQQVAQDLLKNQWRWNSEYYDENGKPYGPDVDDIMEEDYKYEPEE